MKKKQTSIPSFEAGLQAAAIMAEMDRSQIAEDEEKFLSLNDRLFVFYPYCDEEMQKCIMEVSETKDWKSTWQKVQKSLFEQLSKHRKKLLSSLADPTNPLASKDLMSLLWIYSDGMANPELVSSGINSDSPHTFWGLSKENAKLYEALPKFILAYYFLEDNTDLAKFKNDIDFFHKMMPKLYSRPQPPSVDYFGDVMQGLEVYLLDYFSSDSPTWPLDWPSPRVCLKRALNFFK